MKPLKQTSVPIEYKSPEYGLYVIRPPKYKNLTNAQLVEKLLSGHPKFYVGYTSLRLGKRYTDHKATRNGEWRQATGKFIFENQLTFESGCILLGEGNEEEMKLLEYYFRQKPSMGVNRKIGGGEKEFRRIDPKIVKLVEDFKAC